jgi:hypothetical protein
MLIEFARRYKSIILAAKYGAFIFEDTWVCQSLNRP